MTAPAQTRRGLRINPYRGLLHSVEDIARAVFWVFHLYVAKWRFASLPDLCNILRVVTVLALSLLVLDYILLRRTLYDQTSSLLAFNGTRRPTYLLILYREDGAVVDSRYGVVIDNCAANPIDLSIIQALLGLRQTRTWVRSSNRCRAQEAGRATNQNDGAAP